jgi:thioredoxin 1
MANAAVLNVSESSFNADVLESSVPVLVDFWAPWCGPCRMISPIIDEIAEEKAGKVRVAKVNVDDDPGLASQFGIRAIPALLFFKAGSVQGQILGTASKAAILEKLSALE